MAGGAFKRCAARTRLLRVLLRDTQRALKDVQDILHCDPEVPNIVQDITNQCTRPTALVILGSSASAKARLLNCILGRRLLPDTLPRGCRWIKIQYGSSTQVRLIVGSSEFELVNELECNKKPWDTLPLQDLLRQDADLGTTIEIDLNNTFLKDGLRIVIPPDINTDPGSYSYISLKQIHKELYAKKSTILKNFTPIYLFALNKFGSNVFSDDFTKAPNGDIWFSRATKASDSDWKDSFLPVFSSENCLDLHQIKELDINSQVLFVLFANSQSDKPIINSDATESTEVYHAEDLPESDQNIRSPEQSPEQAKTSIRRLQKEQIAFMNEMLDQWEMTTNPPQEHDVKSQWSIVDDILIFKNLDKDTEHKKKKDTDNDRTLKSRSALLNVVVKFATECSTSYLLDQCSKLSEIHVKLLQQFILASFDMARELQVVPKKIQYVAKQEQQLYEAINKMFSEGDKKRELLEIMEEVLNEMRSEIKNMDWSVDDLPCHKDRLYGTSSSMFSSINSSPPLSLNLLGMLNDAEYHDNNAEEALSYDTYTFDDYDIVHSNDESLCMTDVFNRARSKTPTSPISDSSNIRIENEMEVYSLSLLRTSRICNNTTSVCTNSTSVSVRQASLDVQRTVLSKLSLKISFKLVQFLDCLKDNYFGTLQRCLDSLESSCRQELGGRPASEAMRQLLSVARQVDLTPCASFSLLTELRDFLRRLFYRDSEEGCCPLSPAWRRRAALQTAQSLSPQRLARLISIRILERLSEAHERYQSALTSLETALTNRLHHTQDIKLTIRKKYAPTFARLCLESTSMCDLLKYGMPELGREVGRGQYGVVYALRDSWAGHSPAAVKTVLPADERHYNELAMEFFYTRSIPAHPRIVRLLGSLVQRSSSGPPAVWLVTQRCTRDLHAAVRTGLTATQRMLIAMDIVEGIRYLHSLGLVHRDVKLKNVLLDEHNRAALSDLGFCAAESLISGSVVGTPIHMAPELLNGNYHAAVDVYAFGILFWYLCAGSVKLPAAFESFQNKDQLWSKVKRGHRPERLPHFSDECWEIMESCWASEPSQRALLGDIQTKMEKILQTTLQEDKHVVYEQQSQLDDSLDMTGLDDTPL